MERLKSSNSLVYVVVVVPDIFVLSFVLPVVYSVVFALKVQILSRLINKSQVEY